MAEKRDETRTGPKMNPVPKTDPERKMKAVEWWGTKDIQVHDRNAPIITEPKDAILRVTSTCICGSDLHLYNGAFPTGLNPGYRLGHEFMGIVESVGPEVQNFKPGDRAVACFDIGCGECFFCKQGLFSECARSNPEPTLDELYGVRIGGLHGFSNLMGGWPGGQCEVQRVPYADVNLLKVPDDLPDDKVVLLSDILPTAWHGNVMGEVSEGDSVAIWGAGPVGQLAAQCALYRGARKVIVIDGVDYRLQHVRNTLPGVETIDYTKIEGMNVPPVIHDMLGIDGLDVAIECVGVHYAKSTTHKVEVAMKLETDPSDMLNEMITSVRKGGRISVIGAYVGFCNHYNIGAFMEKGLTMRGGQTPVQKYWQDLRGKVARGDLDPTLVITHRPPLVKAPNAYKIFNDKEDNCIKVVMKPELKREE